LLRDGIRRARITRWQRIKAHISCFIWPTKHAMQVLGRLPFDDDELDGWPPMARPLPPPPNRIVP